MAKIIFYTSLVIIFSGCSFFGERIKSNLYKASKNVNCYINTDIKDSVKRVLVMPVSFNSSQGKINDYIYKTLTLNLAKYNYFEVLTYKDFSDDTIGKLSESFKDKASGKYNLSIIQAFGNTNRIDAILFPEVTFFRSYKPLLFGYKHIMIETSKGQIVWSVDDVFDMANREIDILAKNWYYNTHNEDMNPSFQAEIMDISMNNFINFVFSVFCETWRFKETPGSQKDTVAEK